jgi:hypothetical protein
MVDHEADIASDLSAIHRIDDPMSIDGPRYFMLGNRLSAYNGVIGAIAAKRAADEERAESGHAAPATGARGGGKASEVPLASAVAAAPEWIEHVEASPEVPEVVDDDPMNELERAW